MTNLYAIGTDESEIARLGVQHRVWRPNVLDLWRGAGVTEGQVIADVGCGPGYAAIDLAEIVGDSGRVFGIERSERFVRMARSFSRPNLEIFQADLTAFAWGDLAPDTIWCRWVLAFLTDPLPVLQRMAAALKPGGALILHEYFDYGAWHLAPRSDSFNAYVAAVMAHWRRSGGDPDIGLSLPSWLDGLGLRVECLRPVVFAARPQDYVWHWPAGFARSHAKTLEAAGDIADAADIDAALSAYEAKPAALMITPGVLQIVARKPG